MQLLNRVIAASTSWVVVLPLTVLARAYTSHPGRPDFKQIGPPFFILGPIPAGSQTGQHRVT